MGASKSAGSKSSSSRKGGKAHLGLYVSRINKSLSANTGLADSTRRGLATYAADLLERISDGAALMAKRDKVETIKPRHVQGAISLIYSGELRRNALKEAARSCVKYAQSA